MKRYRRVDNVFAADLDGELVMMSVDSGRYFSLNGVGSEIWAHLEVPRSIEDVVEHLLTLYEVDPAICRQEITVFLENLKRRGMIVSD